MSQPLTIAWIRERVHRDEYIITRHAEVERRNDGLSLAQVEEILKEGELLESYPDDLRGPSCLVLGRAGEQSVHVVCGRNSEGWLVIITVYVPRLPKWLNPRQRNRA